MATIPIPPSAAPDVKECLRKIRDEIDRLVGGRNVDWHGRRIINAGRAVDPGDYVTLAQAQEISESGSGAAGGAASGAGGTVADTGAVLFATSGGQPAGNAPRFSWDDVLFILDIEGDIIGATWQGSIIAVDRGGTGLSSGISGGVLAFTASGVLQSSPQLAAGQVVVGGGAGATPTTPGATIADILAGGTVITADPVSPADDTYWVVREGSGPTVLSLKARIAGATHVIATISF